MKDEVVKQVVGRFLSWKLPSDFAPDAGISFVADYNVGTDHPARHEPLGTNLLSAGQAEAMVRYILAGLSISPQSAGEASYRAWADSQPVEPEDATVESLTVCATMLETYAPDCFPANEAGQVSFARSMMDATVRCLRAYLAANGGADLSFAALRSVNLARCARWHPRGLSEWSLSDWGVATAGEMGEALNVVKKLNRERDGIAGNTATTADLLADLADELADVAIYLDIMAASEGIDLAAAIARKFNRTSVKVGFPERLPEPAA